MSKVSQEELQKSLQYLDEFEKGQTGMQIDENANGGKEEKISQYKEKLNCHIQKAKQYKGALDKLEKGEDAEVMEEDEETKKVEGEEEDEETKKGIKKSSVPEQIGTSNLTNVEELRKSIQEEVISKVSEKFDELIKGKNSEINELKSKIEEIEKAPIRKSIVKSAQAVVLEKALKGEATEDGKKLLSKKFQKGQISDVLFNAWETEKDEIKKARYADAVAQFESTGSYIAPSVVEELYKSKNIQIID